MGRCKMKWPFSGETTKPLGRNELVAKYMEQILGVEVLCPWVYDKVPLKAYKEKRRKFISSHLQQWRNKYCHEDAIRTLPSNSVPDIALTAVSPQTYRQGRREGKWICQVPTPYQSTGPLARFTSIARIWFDGPAVTETQAESFATVLLGDPRCSFIDRP